MSIRVESITFPARRCPRCKTIYPDKPRHSVLVCGCDISDADPVNTVPVECTVKYLDAPHV